MYLNHTNVKGFTLIELLVVISIIGLLASIVVVSLSISRDKAKVVRVQADLNQLHTALTFLELDTNQLPSHLPPSPCVQDPEIYLDESSAGIQATDGSFPGWNGPYMSSVPEDPWGNRYIFDPDFTCSGAVTGCEGISSTVRAIHSGGPNQSGINVYDADNIVLVLCSP